MLKVSKLSASYGRIKALHEISIEVKEGEICGILGPNGAGKTTLIKSISGIIRDKDGSIIYKGKSIGNLKAEQIVKLGIIQIPQGRSLFPELTVDENLQMGAYIKKCREKYSINRKKVHELFPRLAERSDQLAGTLSGGEQQMLAIGRALMSCPQFLIIDEPSLGLAPKIVDEIFSVIKQINKENTTILLAEQNARKVFTLAKQCYIIESGRISIEGQALDLIQNERVRHSYLGVQ